MNQILTKAEQRLLGRLPRESFFSTGEVAQVLEGKLGRRGYIVEVLDRLVESGALLRVKRGLYYSGSVGDKSFRYRAGFAYAQGKAYLAFGTALYFHGMTDQVPTAYHYATENKRAKVSLFGADYFFTPLGKHYYGSIEAGGFRVSSKAKTVYDCLLKPRLAGGESATVEALKQAGFGREEWEELLSYFVDLGSDRLIQKTGVVLEKSNAAPEWFLGGLHDCIRGGSGIVVSGKGKFNAKWRVYADG